MIRIAFAKAVAILVPPRCAVCTLPSYSTPCHRCTPPLPQNIEGRCSKCFSPCFFPVCTLCEAYPESFRKLRYLWRYDTKVELAIRAMKYRPSLRTTMFFGKMLAQELESLFYQTDDMCWDFVVPMPSCRRSLKKRGFHHVMELTRSICKQHPSFHKVDCLRMRDERRQQARLPSSLRFSGLKSMIEIPEKFHPQLLGKRVLLVDDVVTSGATSFAAVRELKKCGALEVDLLALALGKRWEMFRAKRSKLCRRN